MVNFMEMVNIDSISTHTTYVKQSILYSGILYFTHGSRYEGVWVNGREESGEYIFSDDLQYEPNDWSYCTESDDRRFYQVR